MKARLRPGVTLRYFTFVPRDATGQPHRFRRFAVRLWVHAISGPATAQDLDLLFKGADAVVFVRPVTAESALVKQARQTVNRLLRKHKRHNAPVVRQTYGAVVPGKKPGDGLVRPGPVKTRNEGVFGTVRLLMRAIMLEFKGKKKATMTGAEEQDGET